MLGGMSLGGLATGSARAGALEPPEVGDLAPFFPGYELKDLIGCGGMAAVYRAHQTALDRDVAIKVLFNEDAENPEFTERFRREAQALAKLTHPNIVAVHDFGELEDFFYIVMEFVDGTDLASLIAAGTLDARQSLEIVVQICTALQFAHDHRVIHRDIKPANILITKDGEVKIADFGLAKLVDHRDEGMLTTRHDRLGTPLYMAPEQRRSTADTDHRADIYSLGVVFYEMLTGELPSGRFPPPSQNSTVDSRIDRVVLKSMESEPARRYQTAREVSTRVEKIQASRGLAKRGTGSRVALVAALGVVAILVLAVVAFIRPSGDAPVVPLAVSVERGAQLSHPGTVDADYFGYSHYAEDGLAIAGAPQGADHTTLAGSGFVSVLKRAESHGNWLPVATLTDPLSRFGDRFGAVVEANEEVLAVGAPGGALNKAKGTPRSGVVLIYDRKSDDPEEWKLVQRLSPPKAVTRQFFGISLAIKNDRLAVGANGTANGTGSVFIFEQRSNGQWEFSAELQHPGHQDGASFGHSVALDGDIMVAGAIYEDEGATTRQGAAHVYHRNAEGSWVHRQRLTAEPGIADARFGVALDIDGDRLAVGCYHDSFGSGTQQGTVYLFERDHIGSNEWKRTARIEAPESGTHMHFGMALDLAGQSLLVGAEYVMHEGRRLGAAYLFEETAAELETWHLKAKLFRPEASRESSFGYSVRLLPEVISVGSPRFGGAGVSGAIYQSSREFDELESYPLASASGKFSPPLAANAVSGDRNISTSMVSPTSFVRHSAPKKNDRSGHSLRWKDKNVLVMGAPEGIYHPYLYGAGFVSVLVKDGDRWKEARRLSDPNGQLGDRFGFNVATSERFLAVSAPSAEAAGEGGIDAGAVFVYHAPQHADPREWALDAVLFPEEPAQQFFGGHGLAFAGDTLIIAANAERQAQGAVYVYQRLSDGWRMQQKLTARNPQTGDRFGASIALQDHLLAVGAYSHGIDRQGSVTLFRKDRAGSRWQEVAMVPGEVGQQRRFGRYLVFASSDELLVSADRDLDSTGTIQGAVYVVRRGILNGIADGEDWAITGKLRAPGQPKSGNLGVSMAMTGGRLFVGSDSATFVKGGKRGAVYEFRRGVNSPSGWTPVKTWMHSPKLQWQGFGWSLSGHGHQLAISSPMHSSPQSVSGGAFLIDLEAGQ